MKIREIVLRVDGEPFPLVIYRHRDRFYPSVGSEEIDAFEGEKQASHFVGLVCAGLALPGVPRLIDLARIVRKGL